MIPVRYVYHAAYSPLSLSLPPSIKFPSSFPIPGQNITLFHLRCFSFNGWTGLPRGDPLSLGSSPVYESRYVTGQWEWRCLSLYRKGGVLYELIQLGGDKGIAKAVRVGKRGIH